MDGSLPPNSGRLVPQSNLPSSGRKAVSETTQVPDPSIRHYWNSARDFSDFRSLDDQLEFRTLRHQLGIDVSRSNN